MDEFVRVPEQRSGRCTGCAYNVPLPGEPDENCAHPHHPAKHCLETKTIFAKVEPKARTNDPATSKGKRKINKYEEEVLAQLSLIGPSTGKEIAALSQQPLNCITPRFAPLRRKGLIKDIGVRRDKQIVWVLA